MSNSLSRTERDILKKKYSKYFTLVKKIINELDPVGLIGMGAPEDEHDTLTGQVLLLIVNDRMDEVRELIIKSHERYGYGVDTIRDEFKGKFYKEIDETTKKINDLYKNYKEEKI
ncbi:hypothetical protein AMS62_19670 [Bacillus sp. FJAT-18019]|nr:hypothetical protein AMS62_19670 [Bacillus sp. FJAT-18019]